jgi:hypothetical protein
MTEITECGRTMAGEFVAFDIQWDGDLEGQSVTWSMVISSQDGKGVVRLGYENLEGDFAAQYVADESSQRRTEVDRNADLRDHEITVRFPANIVGVAVEWPVWTALLTVDGQDVASQVVQVA